MNFQGFNDSDFDVFKVNGLEPRMDHIKAKIRPKLEELGRIFAPTLSTYTGDEMFSHVAKHARRKVNPPDDTWVAFANNKRGYKKLPHFQIGMWETHLFAWFAVIYESPIKVKFAGQLSENLNQMKKDIPANYVWSTDHTQPSAVPHQEADLEAMIERLSSVKKAEILCGIHIERDHPLVKDGDKLVKEIENTFQTLMPLYELAKSSY